jgi:hypothetical protein
MCFSPEADIGGGLLICAIGVDAVRHIRQRREFIAMAWIPVLLGAHQFIEALVWLWLQGHVPAGIGHVALWAYLLIAFVVLPVFIPLAVIALEPTRRRKQLMAPFAVIGTVVAAILLAAMVRGPVSVTLASYHLSYSIRLSDGLLIVALYVVAVCGPLLVSGYRNVALFGIVNLVAVIIIARLTISGFGRHQCRDHVALPGRQASPSPRQVRALASPCRLADPRRGQGDGQPGQQDVEAAFEFGGAVVGRQDRSQAAEQGKLADRQAVQAQPQQVVGLVRVVDEFLQFVEDVAVQEPEQRPVDVQGVGPAEPGAGEQGQDVFERAQGARGAQRQRGGQRPGDQERHHVRVSQRQLPVVAGHGPQLAGPVRVGGIDLELGEHDLDDAVEQRRLVRRVPVEDHRIAVQGAGEPAHGQTLSPVAVDDLKRRSQHDLASDLAAPPRLRLLPAAVVCLRGQYHTTFRRPTA